MPLMHPLSPPWAVAARYGVLLPSAGIALRGLFSCNAYACP